MLDRNPYSFGWVSVRPSCFFSRGEWKGRGKKNGEGEAKAEKREDEGRMGLETGAVRKREREKGGMIKKGPGDTEEEGSGTRIVVG